MTPLFPGQRPQGDGTERDPSRRDPAGADPSGVGAGGPSREAGDVPDQTTTGESRDASTAVASREDNARLDHTRGGRTTRSDRTDTGVPMTPGSRHEPAGPEDALGVGEKRGDYRERIPGNPHESRPVDGGGEAVTRYVNRKTGAAASQGDNDAIAVQVDNVPTAEVVPQKPRTETIGDAGGLKGGVETDPLAAGAGGAAARAAAAAADSDAGDRAE